jgi:hypothetical protein
VVLLIGALDWSLLNTSQTRADKGDDKKLLGEPFGSPVDIQADEQRAKVPDIVQRQMRSASAAGGELRTSQDLRRVEQAGRWSVRANGNEEPLTKEAGYRSARPDFGEHARRLGRIGKSATFSAFKAAKRLVDARQERARCATELDAVIQALRKAGFASTPGRMPAKSDSLAGRRAQLEEFDVVRQLRQRPPGRASHSTVGGSTAAK